MNFEKWGRTRLKGKSWFVWVVGFLGWGIATAVGWLVVMHLIRPLQFDEQMWVRSVIALVLFPAVGLIWAPFVWTKSEKIYAEFSGNL